MAPRKISTLKMSAILVVLVFVFVIIALWVSDIIVSAYGFRGNTALDIRLFLVLSALLLAFGIRVKAVEWFDEFVSMVSSTPWRAILVIFIGIFLGAIFAIPITMALAKYPYATILVSVLSPLFFALVLFVRRNDLPFLGGERISGKVFILDTSALIDGRIARIVKEFPWLFDGVFVVPDLVLTELRGIADNRDEPGKRDRGLRGIGVLEEMRQLLGDRLQIVTYPKGKAVDDILIEEARRRGAVLITTDNSLAEVAKASGVDVININWLFYGLRPDYEPGDVVKVFVVKEGKEHGQGIGFLPDGSLLVVRGGARHIGNHVAVKIDTVKVSPSGRIYFGEVVG